MGIMLVVIPYYIIYIWVGWESWEFWENYFREDRKIL